MGPRDSFLQRVLQIGAALVLAGIILATLAAMLYKPAPNTSWNLPLTSTRASHPAPRPTATPSPSSNAIKIIATSVIWDYVAPPTLIPPTSFTPIPIEAFPTATASPVPNLPPTAVPVMTFIPARLMPPLGGPFEADPELLPVVAMIYFPLLLNLPSDFPPLSSLPANWPQAHPNLSASKISIHVIRNGDPLIMEFVRRGQPRVIKAVDDIGWLKDVKAASPGTLTIGRFDSYQLEEWAEVMDPAEAARRYIAHFLEHYRIDTYVDYWEGWNEFVPVRLSRIAWFAQFEAERACQMRALGLRAAVGGFSAGTPEYDEMAQFIPALEAAYRCGGIFTLHEMVMPIINCDTGYGMQIPGSPVFKDTRLGMLSFRYRYFYEGFLKPKGIGDLPLMISELAVGGINPASQCNGPGGASWKDFSRWWVEQGTGRTGEEAFVNILAWYDQEMRYDRYVLGTTIFTAGATTVEHGWHDMDIHDPLPNITDYVQSQK